jgi:hypothetical protein
MMDCVEWQPYFAWTPVQVDTYDISERKDGQMRYLKWGWVERSLLIWTSDDFGDGPVEHRVWRFRLARCPEVKNVGQ